MKKLLIIVPHLSTGGLPQVTLNKIELLKNDFDIRLIEYQVIALVFNIQRNKILSILNENVYTLYDNKFDNIKNIINDFNPDIISIEEFPEMFMHKEVADWLYNSNLNIIETTHDSSFDPKNKIYLPSRFVFVSAYNAFKYMDLCNDKNIPFDVIEYPVDSKERNQEQLKDRFGLEFDYKHIVIVGLFTERKNQAYAFEIAKKLSNYKIKFHFLGNQADNFKYYWEPLLNNKPDNCVIWGERSDVSDFVAACDIFLFPSKGNRGNKELNPIAIKEALEYNVVKMMYNLDVYCNKYNDYDDVIYLTGDVNNDTSSVLSILGLNKIEEEVIIIGTYPNLKKRVDLTKECITSARLLGRKIMLVSHYPVDKSIQEMVDYYVYDKHNPLITHSYYNLFYNRNNEYDAEININQLHNGNQSLTVLTNIFNGVKNAKSLGFKRFFYLTFDVIINPLDIDIINESFYVCSSKKAYLSQTPTAFDYGIQTNGMTFDIDFFINTFDDVRTSDEYNLICSKIGAQNFLEDYLVKKINNVDQNLLYIREMVRNAGSGDQTFLANTGTGVSSYSEYYSILPVTNKKDVFIFYFYTYNIDNRIIEVSIDDIMFKIDISKNKEYKKEFNYTGNNTIILRFYDGADIYKTEVFEMNASNIDKYINAGKFEWKLNQRPKIKLVHIQTNVNDEREQKSRESLMRVSKYGWEYILQVNELYKSLPPSHNCLRPECVSMTLFDNEQTKKYGPALTPAHYGCYDAFKNAILTEFNDCDFLMVCEGDCLIDMDLDEFIRKVEKCANLLDKNGINYMSFGDTATLDNAWPQSPMISDINEDMYKTDHIIGLQCIMFPKSVSNYLKNKLRTSYWDAADMYFNYIFAGPQMGIVKNRFTTQADGVSFIDNDLKVFIKK